MALLFYLIYGVTAPNLILVLLYSMDLVTPQSGLTRSHGCLYEPNDNHRDGSQYMGFEQMWQNNSYRTEVHVTNEI